MIRKSLPEEACSREGCHQQSACQLAQRCDRGAVEEPYGEDEAEHQHRAIPVRPDIQPMASKVIYENSPQPAVAPGLREVFKGAVGFIGFGFRLCIAPTHFQPPRGQLRKLSAISIYRHFQCKAFEPSWDAGQVKNNFQFEAGLVSCCSSPGSLKHACSCFCRHKFTTSLSQSLHLFLVPCGVLGHQPLTRAH